MPGYVPTVHNLVGPTAEWTLGGELCQACCARRDPDCRAGIPLVTLLDFVERKKDGSLRPQIRSSLLDTSGKTFRYIKSKEEEWLHSDAYTNPGPIQFTGVSADERCLTLVHEDHSYLPNLKQLAQHLSARPPHARVNACDLI